MGDFDAAHPVRGTPNEIEDDGLVVVADGEQIVSTAHAPPPIGPDLGN